MQARSVVLAAVALVGVLLAVQSCSGKPACSASTCSAGCCDATGSCVTSTNALQCGSLGSMCKQCLAGQSCTLGTCSGSGVGGGSGSGGGSGGGMAASCASRCQGCCDAQGTCLAGTANNACGRGGLTCAGCTGSQNCNMGGECIDLSCATCVYQGSCQATLSDSRCGGAGISCNDCTANGGTCNTGSGSCQGGTCGGCRDALGRCLSGDAKGACGSVGNNCVACTGTDVCANGTCVAGGVGGGSGGGGSGGGTAAGGGTGGGGTGGGGVGGGGTGGGGVAASGDNCNSVIDLGSLVSTLTVHANTVGKADDTTLMCGSPGNMGRDQVFSFVASRNGGVTGQIQTSTGTPTLELRAACQLVTSSLSCSPSAVGATVVQGVTYYLWVDGSANGEDTFIGLLIE